MRKALFKLSFISIFFVFISQKTTAQCDNSQLSENCISALDTSFHFLKTYSLNAADAENLILEHSYVLTRGTDYFIKLCTVNGESDIQLDIYNSKRVRVGGTSDTNEDPSVIEYDCKVTGIYYMSFTFKDGGNNCGTAVLSFQTD